MRSDRADLFAVGWLCLTWAAAFLPDAGGLRAVVVLPAVLFLPGDALLGALFPTAEELSVLERVAFSVVASVAVGILLGTALLVSVGLTTATALLGLSAVVGGGVLLARRRRPSTEEAPGVGFRPRAAALDAVGDLRGTGGFGAAVAALVVVAALAGAGGTALLAVHERPGYTEFAVLPPDDSLAADDYRRAVATDRPLRVRITNHHRHQVRYAVVVLAERTDGEAVAATRRLDRFAVAVPAGETETVRNSPAPPWSNHTRLVYRLYRVGDGGDRHVADAHVWLNATGAAAASTPPGAVV